MSWFYGIWCPRLKFDSFCQNNLGMCALKAFWGVGHLKIRIIYNNLKMIFCYVLFCLGFFVVFVDPAFVEKFYPCDVAVIYFPSMIFS